MDWRQAISGLAFAFLFCAFALGASWVLANAIHDAQRARDWVAANATVNAFGDDTVAYQYEFGGAWHGGNRRGILLFQVKGNLDSWDADMTAQMALAYANKTPITVWVNPQNPDESMVNRDTRWAFILAAVAFALAFGGIGVAVLWLTLRRIFGAPAFRLDEHLPAVTRRAPVRSYRSSDPMVRYRESSAAGAAFAKQMQRAAFIPRFMMGDAFPYIVIFGMVAVLIVGISLALLVFWTGQA